MTLKIYGLPRSRAIRNIWMAEEQGIPYQLVETPFGPSGTKSEAFLAVNPNGQVPCIDDDGLILWESLAINLHLARKYGGPLAPTCANEEAKAAMWSIWAVSALEPHLAQATYHTAMLPEGERDPAVVERSLAAAAGPLAVLDGALAKGGGFLMGNRFTVADLNLAGVVFYARFTPQALADKPAIRAWYGAAMARPANRRAFALRGE